MLLDKREEGFDFVSGIHQFNDNREVFRQPFYLEGMNDTSIGTKSHQATKYRGSCQSLCFGLGDNPFIERLILISVALAMYIRSREPSAERMGHLQIT